MKTIHNKPYSLHQLLQPSSSEMTKMIEDDIPDLITKSFVHSIKEIESRITPLRGDCRYIGLLNDKGVVIREFSSSRAENKIKNKKTEVRSMYVQRTRGNVRLSSLKHFIYEDDGILCDAVIPSVVIFFFVRNKTCGR